MCIVCDFSFQKITNEAMYFILVVCEKFTTFSGRLFSSSIFKWTIMLPSTVSPFSSASPSSDTPSCPSCGIQLFRGFASQCWIVSLGSVQFLWRWVSQVDEICRDVFGHLLAIFLRNVCRWMHQFEWKEWQHGSVVACGSVVQSPRQTSTFAMLCASSCCQLHPPNSWDSSWCSAIFVLFEDWTYSSLPQLPSVWSTGARADIDRPWTNGAVPQRPSPFPNPGRSQYGNAVPQHRPTAVSSPPSDNHSSTGVASSTPSEDSVLRGLVHRLVDVCQSNQSFAGWVAGREGSPSLHNRQHGAILTQDSIFVSLFVVCLRRMARGETLRSEVRCRGKGAAAVGHSFAVSRQAVPGEGGRPLSGTMVRCVDAVRSGTSILVVCPSGSPRWASCVCEETLVSVASWPVCCPGQGPDRCWTASPTYEQGQGNSRETFPGGDVFGRHKSWRSLGRPKWADVDARRLRGAAFSIRQGPSETRDTQVSLVGAKPMAVGLAMFKRDGKSRRQVAHFDNVKKLNTFVIASTMVILPDTVMWVEVRQKRLGNPLSSSLDVFRAHSVRMKQHLVLEEVLTRRRMSSSLALAENASMTA